MGIDKKNKIEKSLYREIYKAVYGGQTDYLETLIKKAKPHKINDYHKQKLFLRALQMGNIPTLMTLNHLIPLHYIHLHNNLFNYIVRKRSRKTFQHYINAAICVENQNDVKAKKKIKPLKNSSEEYNILHTNADVFHINLHNYILNQIDKIINNSITISFHKKNPTYLINEEDKKQQAFFIKTLRDIFNKKAFYDKEEKKYIEKYIVEKCLLHIRKNTLFLWKELFPFFDLKATQEVLSENINGIIYNDHSLLDKKSHLYSLMKDQQSHVDNLEGVLWLVKHNSTFKKAWENFYLINQNNYHLSIQHIHKNYSQIFPYSLKKDVEEIPQINRSLDCQKNETVLVNHIAHDMIHKFNNGIERKKLKSYRSKKEIESAISFFLNHIFIPQNTYTFPLKKYSDNCENKNKENALQFQLDECLTFCHFSSNERGLDHYIEKIQWLNLPLMERISLALNTYYDETTHLQCISPLSDILQESPHLNWLNQLKNTNFMETLISSGNQLFSYYLDKKKYKNSIKNALQKTSVRILFSKNASTTLFYETTFKFPDIADTIDIYGNSMYHYRACLYKLMHESFLKELLGHINRVEQKYLFDHPNDESKRSSIIQLLSHDGQFKNQAWFKKILLNEAVEPIKKEILTHKKKRKM